MADQDEDHRRDEPTPSRSDRHSREPAGARFVGCQIKARQSHRSGQHEHAAGGQQNPKLAGFDFDAAYLQSRIEDEYGGSDAERHQVRHRIELSAKTGCRFEQPRSNAIHGIEKATPDDKPGRKFKIADLRRHDRAETEQ